ncbi:Complement component 1 Q subcomponent-binding protein, mitochondrial, partial [Cichlidogyrus casuarinus]
EVGASDLDVRPEMSIRIRKPSGKAIIFHCSLPSKEEEVAPEEEQGLKESFVVDSVELQELPGYFVYADLFDDNMYDHMMQLLADRGLNDQFQQELREFCAAEEHLLYRKFLTELKTFCEE